MVICIAGDFYVLYGLFSPSLGMLSEEQNRCSRNQLYKAVKEIFILLMNNFAVTTKERERSSSENFPSSSFLKFSLHSEKKEIVHSTYACGFCREIF